ncbi:TetR family transcriptional regulator [Planotetraspora thailandica]|uniref:TetR family transcriptional regulator n=1 Tax=Planotetraspora thailandica TaxID=487172 RepID=A0A8J3V4Q6_9ACTN|nr:TetR/AcrR family transcriptional regulator [Planotetraspora thailandica]GII57362.1 TetR family transcriptional regulator [Planotetraspora thailandica]
MTAEQAPRVRRPYRSPHRERQAAETRRAVLAAAARLFGEGGWAGTGMREVARAAGVSVETVYAHFRSKGELLVSVLDVAVVGDAGPEPLARRPEFAALTSGTRGERVAAAAGLVTTIHQRTAGVYLVLREAAASDGDLDGLLTESEERRRISVEQGISMVLGRPATREERDGLWAVLSVEVYQLLTERSGWTPRQYEGWLAGVIDRLTT